MALISSTDDKLSVGYSRPAPTAGNKQTSCLMIVEQPKFTADEDYAFLSN